MSEEWNGIKLGEVKVARLLRLSGAISTIRRLIDLPQDVDWVFNTSTNGAVIVSDNYLTWEFIAPDNYTVTAAATVGGLVDNLTAATTASPVPAWDDFAVFLSNKRSTINSFLAEGASASIIDANGTSYAGTQHLLPVVADFPELLVWMKTWFGADFLAANSSVIYTAGVARFALSADGVTINCTIKV